MIYVGEVDDYIDDEWFIDDEPPEPIEDDPEFPHGRTVRVASYGGVAWRVRHVLDGRVVCVMVGDDRPHTFDREELSPLKRSEFCGSCGQIGCGHDTYDDDEEE